MNTIEATFRIVTPMFIGGADQSPTDGIRPPSVKGALRFWWRALNWGRFHQAHSGNEAEAMKALHKREAELFGLAAKTVDGHQVGGQGLFLLKLSNGLLKYTNKPTIHPNFKDYAAARYLGYGLMVAFGRNDGTTRSGQLERGCLNENQEFTVTLVFRRSIEASVQEALVAWGLLGGLGSRSRHGMGSVALISLKSDGIERWTAPTDERSYIAQIKSLLSSPANTIPLPATEPPFTAFWKDSRIDRLLSGTDCYSVLNDFGKAMLMYRSWGRSKIGGGSYVLDAPSEQRFKDDHHWYRDVPGWSATHPNFHPERVEFGLPHNYHQHHHHVVSEIHERRATPLLFHVHQVGTQFVGIAIYLPAQFLPKNEKIKANGTNVPAKIGWSVITKFLDGKVGDTPASPKPTAPLRFPDIKAVLP